MDKFVSIFAFPIATLICFGPVLFVWLREERREAAAARSAANPRRDKK